GSRCSGPRRLRGRRRCRRRPLRLRGARAGLARRRRPTTCGGGLLFLPGTAPRRAATEHGVVGDTRDLAGELGDTHPTLVSPAASAPRGRVLLLRAHALEQLRHGDLLTVRILGHRQLPFPSPPTSRSRRCRMSPSRRAHGQIFTLSSPNARIDASATSAPATTWYERSELTPSNSALSAAVMREMNAITWRRPAAVRTLSTRGPSDDGAAPVRRASIRNVLEVAHARSGSPAARSSLAGPSSSASMKSRN